eukprot:TRINITY_DN174_c0_g3_i2.p1 TRINITY_DN174_c0_g3~~TRINITY_DN174_c0_g3_i2.p1  ORF type:complete len:932 (+),score=249.00 TRINITY_DN174_c0_g3_i2:1540-4335(+)
MTTLSPSLQISPDPAATTPLRQSSFIFKVRYLRHQLRSSFPSIEMAAAPRSQSMIGLRGSQPSQTSQSTFLTDEPVCNDDVCFPSSQISTKKSGWMRLKNRFRNSETYFFELDSFTEFVQYFRYENNAKTDISKNRMIGSFSLEGAQINSDDQVKKGKEEKYRIIVKTKRSGKKYTLTVNEKEDRDDWKRAMEKARDRAVSAKDMLAEWQNQDDIVKSVLPDKINEEAIETEVVAAEQFEEAAGGDYTDFMSLPLVNLEGKKVEMRTALDHRVNVLLLLRHFGCILCRRAVGRVMSIKPQLDALGVNVIAIGQGSAESARVFLKDHKFTGKLFVDEKREVFKALNCNRGFKYMLTKKTAEVVRQAHKEGFRQGPIAGMNGGDDRQLGGCFVVSNAGDMVYKAIEQYAGDPADLSAVVTSIQKYMEDSDRWSTRPKAYKPWDALENIATPQNLIAIDKKKVPGTPDESLQNSGRFRYEFGKPEFQMPNKFDLTPQIAYYNDHFANRPHANFLSGDPEDPKIGPVCISMETSGSFDKKALIRTIEGDIRTLIPQEHAANQKDMMKYLKTVHPYLEKINFNEVTDTSLIQDLVEYESKFIIKKYKFGVLYVKDGQTDENDIFANVKGSDEFEEFLQMLGKKVLLRGFKGYRGGLDTKNDTTGTHSYYTTFQNVEIMFHVQTLLPNHEADLQRVEKKRHLGNDVVMIIFKEGNRPFDLTTLQNQFNHIFLVAQAEKEKGKTSFRISNAAQSVVNTYEPFIPAPGVFAKSDKLRDFILCKLINGERQAMLSRDFLRRESRTRKELLREFVTVYGGPVHRNFFSLKSSTMSSFRESSPSTPRRARKDLSNDINFRKFQTIIEMCNGGIALYRAAEETDQEVKSEGVIGIFGEIHKATSKESVDPSEGTTRLIFYDSENHQSKRSRFVGLASLALAKF